MAYKGSYSTIAGTMVNFGTFAPENSAEYNIANSILIHTNESPISWQNNLLYFGSFKTLDELSVYYNSSSKVYKLVEAMLSQQNYNRLQNNSNYNFVVYYKEGSDATYAYYKTTNINNRLTNFAPATTGGIKKCVLTIKSNSESTTIPQKKYFNFTKQPTLQELCDTLNRAGFNCLFEIDNNEIKISSDILGADNTITISATTEAGFEDLSGSDYLNLSGDCVAGTNSSGNVDFVNDILTLKENGVRVGCCTTTALLEESAVETLNTNLNLLASNNSFYIPCVYNFETIAEYKKFCSSVPKTTLLCVGTSRNERLCGQGIILSAGASTNASTTRRNDPEWSEVVMPSDSLSNFVGFNNSQVNEVKNNCYGTILSYKSDNFGLTIEGCNKGWSVAEYFAFSQLVNYIIIGCANTERMAGDKTRSTDGIAKITTCIDNIAYSFYNNNYLSNEPDETDPSFQSLTQEQINKIKTYGFYVKAQNSEGNVINIDFYVCMKGIIATINIKSVLVND